MKKLTLIMAGAAMALSVQAQTPQLNPNNIDEVVKAMTLDEKAHLVNGIGTFWGGDASCRTDRDISGGPGGSYEVARLGIPGMQFGDGPLGIRMNEMRDFSNHHYYTTAEPVPLLLGSSWDEKVIYDVAQDIAEECRDYGVDVMLGPSFNILRNPLGGRTHEYYSEDPLLAGLLAAAFTEGVQSVGVGASVKHFAANNQETNRNAVNTIVSQRALREIYLKAFEIAIKKSNPWTVMTSYNGVNGDWTSESTDLLQGVLRGDWGYEGMVMTDWGGGKHAVKQMKAGNDLLEPGSEAAAQEIIKAVKDGSLDEKVLDENVHRILEMVVKTLVYKKFKNSNTPDLTAHQAMARKAGAEGAILLKNEKQALPFSSAVKNVAIYGKTGYDIIPGGIGWGESNAGNYCISLVEGLRLAGYEVDHEVLRSYAYPGKPGPYGMWMVEKPADEIIPTAEDLAQQVQRNDVGVVVLGHKAGEGMDRTRAEFYLTDAEKNLVKEVSSAYHKAGKKVVVLLNIPGAIEVESWKQEPDAILCIYQGGEQIGNWVADMLSGKVTPSGKLTTTFAKDLMDYPSSDNYPVLEKAYDVRGMMAQGANIESHDGMVNEGNKNIDYVVYEEGIYNGYRYFDTFGVEVSYPFGYGLSYTTFDYSDAKISQQGDTFSVSVTVKNTGNYNGKEIVQLYVSAPKGKLEKPAKELRAFGKTGLLKPGESETVTMQVSAEELASFNSAKSQWETDKGVYTFHVAASVADVKASLKARVNRAWNKKVNNVLKPQVSIQELKK